MFGARQGTMGAMFETLPFAAAWPAWVVDLLSMGATVALAWLGAHVLRVVVVSRLAVLAARTRGKTDDVIVAEVRRRIGLWGVLAGLYLSLAYWPLDPHWDWVASRVIAAIAVTSVTFAVSAVATRAVLPRVRLCLGSLAHGDGLFTPRKVAR